MLVETKFNPDEPRDRTGEWTSSGSDSEMSQDSISKDDVERAHFSGQGVSVSFENGESGQQHLRNFFGRDLSPHEITRLVGAPDGADISIDGHNGSIAFSINHPLYAQQSDRLLEIRDGVPVLDNQDLFLKEDAPQGLGTHIFAHQVKQAVALGVHHIETYAGKGEAPSGYMVGYYVWPRLGYDSDLSANTRQMARNSVRVGSLDVEEPQRVSDLMQTEKGRAFWKKFGIASSLVFDLSDGSLSRHVLGSYLKEKNYEVKFNPSEPRDRTGEWTSGGAVANSDNVESTYFQGKDLSITHEDNDEEGTHELMNKLFGRQLTTHELGRLVGAPDNSVINVFPIEELVRGERVPAARVTIKNSMYHPSDSRRLIYRDPDGNLVLHNEWLYVKKGSPPGFGTHVFAHQVKQAASLGFSKILTEAARSKNENGYYTWPRLGYDAPLDRWTLPVAQEDLGDPEIERVSDVMATPEGRDWWRANGPHMNLSFDLRENSLSRRVLSSYLKEKNYEVKFNPNEPRNPHGEWTSGGGSSSFTPDGERRARDVEQSIYKLNNHERLVALRPDGSSALILDGQNIDFSKSPGERSSGVDVSENHRKQLAGMVLIHNHPLGWAYPEGSPEHEGQSFTLTDIALAAENGAREMRAITPVWRYIMRPPKNGWSRNWSFDVLHPTFQRHHELVHQQFTDAILSKRMSISEANALHYHEVWTRVARELGLDYRRERLSNSKIYVTSGGVGDGYQYRLGTAVSGIQPGMHVLQASVSERGSQMRSVSEGDSGSNLAGTERSSQAVSRGSGDSIQSGGVSGADIKFNPDEPRDRNGEWTSGGSSTAVDESNESESDVSVTQNDTETHRRDAAYMGISRAIGDGVKTHQQANQVGDLVWNEAARRAGITNLTKATGRMRDAWHAVDQAERLAFLDRALYGEDSEDSRVSTIALVKADTDAIKSSRDLEKFCRHVSDVISEHQPMGSVAIKSNATGEAHNRMMEVSRYLPDDWVRRSNQYPLNIKNMSDDDGDLEFYVNSSSSLYIREKHSSLDALIHEFVHRVEHVAPALGALEKAHYESRTQGEPLKPLGVPYPHYVVGKRDKFSNIYMGRDYSQGKDPTPSYELVSMVAPKLINGDPKAFADRDLARFVTGVLAGFHPPKVSVVKFNPNEPRAENGEWTAGGGVSGVGKKPSRNPKPSDAWTPPPRDENDRQARIQAHAAIANAIGSGVTDHEQASRIGDLVWQEAARRLGFDNHEAVLGKLKKSVDRYRKIEKQCADTVIKHGWDAVDFDLIEKAEKVRDRAFHQYDAFAKAVCGVIAEHQKLGGEHVAATGPQAKRLNSVVAGFMPTHWIQASNLSRLRAVDAENMFQACYTPSDRSIALSEESPRSDLLHEFVHRAEHVVPGLSALEKGHYESRTQNEESLPLGPPFQDYEWGRRDEFADTYMGKDYSDLGDEGGFYELLSMSAPHLLTGDGRAFMDLPLAKFATGVLTGHRAQPAEIKVYNPDEPRNQIGEWTSGGDSGATAAMVSPGENLNVPGPTAHERIRRLVAAGLHGDPERAKAIGDVVMEEASRRSGISDLQGLMSHYSAAHKATVVAEKQSADTIKQFGPVHSRSQAAKSEVQRLEQLERTARAPLVRYARAVQNIIGEHQRLGGETVSVSNLSDRSITPRLQDLPLPDAWVRRSNAAGPMTVMKTSGRSEYIHGKNEMHLNPDADYPRVAVHEWLHRAEDSVPGIRDLEQKYYNQRTEGEQLVPLGAPYGPNEVGREDHFASKYMGRDYGGRAFELLSVAGPGILAGSPHGYADQDVSRFVIGLLIGVYNQPPK